MSVLSLQADKLRKYAERLHQLAANQGFPARQDLYESAAEMCEAADTIESLRDRLQERETCELEPLPAIVVTMNMINEIGWCKCSKCGYATPEDSNYCQNCGASVKAVDA